MRHFAYARLLLIITLRFTCGKRKICSVIKISQNIIKMMVDQAGNTLKFFVAEGAKETVMWFLKGTVKVL